MTATQIPKPYHVQAKLSETSKAALKREKGRRLQLGNDVSLAEIVSDLIEEWAKTAP